MRLQEIKSSLSRWFPKHRIRASMKQKYFNIIAERHIIRCKLYYRKLKNINTIVLYAHGFGGHKDNRAAEQFAKRALQNNKDLAVIAFNWPCHGDDVSKALSLSLCNDYLRLILSFIERTYAPKHLYGYATSFGGYLYLKYIHEHGMPFEKTALRCPAVPMYDVLTKTIMSAEQLESVRSGNCVPVGFDRKVPVSSDFLNELAVTDLRKNSYRSYQDRLIILQGLADEVVPPSAVKTFAESNGLTFIPIDRADHRFRGKKIMGRAIREILSFFDIRS